MATASVAVALAVQVPVAGALVTATFRDEFTTSSWSGNNGDTNWLDAWTRLPAEDGVSITGGTNCVAPKCLRMGAIDEGIGGAGVYRGANLAGATEAVLSFSYKRVLDGVPAQGGVRLKVGTTAIPGTTLWSATIDGSDPSHQTVSFDIGPWISGTTHIGFFGYGGVVAGHVFIDNVQIVATYGGAPTFTTNLKDRTDTENEWVSVQAAATDPDGDPLAFSATGLPPGITIDADTGRISGQPTYAAANTSPYSVAVVVSDGFASDTDVFSWTVLDKNRKPQLDSIADVTIPERISWTHTVSASDPDEPYGDDLRFILTDAPPGMTIGSAVGTIAWKPSEQQGPGVFAVTVRVEDEGTPQLSDDKSFEVKVQEVNTSPTIASVADQLNGFGDQVSVSLSATDPDVPANVLTFSAIGLPPGLAVSGGTISGGPGVHSVTVIVSDDGVPEAEDSTTMSWTVTDSNRGPVLQFVPAPPLGSDGAVRFTAHAVDPDGDTLRFRLAGSVPTGAAIDAVSGRFAWTPSEAQLGADHSFTVVVDDNGVPSLSDGQTLSIELPPLNIAPVVTQPSDQLSSEGDTVELIIMAADVQRATGHFGIHRGRSPTGTHHRPGERGDHGHDRLCGGGSLRIPPYCEMDKTVRQHSRSLRVRGKPQRNVKGNAVQANEGNMKGNTKQKRETPRSAKGNNKEIL